MLKDDWLIAFRLQLYYKINQKTSPNLEILYIHRKNLEANIHALAIHGHRKLETQRWWECASGESSQLH